MLAWIGRHGIVTAEQVSYRFFSRSDRPAGRRAAYRRLSILESLHLIKRDTTPFWQAPRVLRITKAGAELGEIDLAPARIVEPELRHALALVELIERLAADNPGARLRTEREIRTDRYRERHVGTREPGRGRTPDGEITLADGRIVAIELDLTPKRSKDFERILRAYRQEHFDHVWWYVVPGAVARVQRLVDENRVDDFITVRPWLPLKETRIPGGGGGR